MRKLKVYIAGPLNSSGSPWFNVNQAASWGAWILKIGHTPFIPHLNVLWAMITGEQDEFKYLDWDLEWLRVCDAVVRIPGHSLGADEETATAKTHGIPVYEVCSWQTKQEKEKELRDIHEWLKRVAEGS